MQASTIHHVLSYYVVFQRIVWLLLQHSALDELEYDQQILELNTAFFGNPGDEAPVRCECLRNHLQFAWPQEWRETGAWAYAFTSMLRSLPRPVDSGAEDQTLAIAQAKRMLACALIIAGPDFYKSAASLLEPAAAMFNGEASKLARSLEGLIRKHLSDLSALITNWYMDAKVGLGKKEDELPKRLAARATCDYGLAAYALAKQLKDVENQKLIGEDLPLWLRQISRNEEAATLEDDLLGIIEDQVDSAEMAQILFDQGRDLLMNSEYSSAEPRLNRALRLAESISDPALADRARNALRLLKTLKRL